MRRTFVPRLLGLAAFGAAGLFFVFTAPASAQNPPHPSAGSVEGLYLEPILSTNVVRGDFDGQSFLTDGVELFIMPRFSDSLGLGFSVGWKSESGTIGFYYFHASHDVAYIGAPGTAEFSACGLMLTRQFLRRSPVQPYILMTINFPRVVVMEGAMTADTVAEANFTGIGADLGAGLMFPISPRFYIRGGIVFRGLMLGWVKGPTAVTKSVGDLGLDEWQTHLATVRFGGGSCFAFSAGYTF